jgi:hypothetical protein
MNTTSETHTSHGLLSETIVGGMAGNSITEGIGAIATIALAIIGLAGVFADIVAPVATIVIGAVLLMEGVLAGAAVRRLSSQGVSARQTGMGSGVTAGFFGGLAGIVLGILALFRTAPGASPDILLAVAVLVYGAALLIGGGTIVRTLQFQNQTTAQDMSGATIATGSGSMLIGLATVVLGILAIIGLVPMTLILIGLLSLGAGALFSGSTVSSETFQ